MRIFIILMLFFSAGYATAGYSYCTPIPRGASNPAVKACETYSSYRFTIIGSEYTYSKAEYRAAFAKLLSDWRELHGLTSLVTRVDFWLSVPEANPGATQARAVLKAGDRSFVFFLSVHPQDWSLDNLRVSILGQHETYPDSFGHTAGSLLVKQNTTAQESDLHAYMERYQAYLPQFFAPGWFEYELPVFREQPTKEVVDKDGSAANVVARVELNHIMEWISQRERVFAFSVNTP